MDFAEKIFELTKRVRTHRERLTNEEMTKNTLVLPFIQALGYDVFNPAEVVPEFSAPIGEYKDARVDYAILEDGKPILLIECKTLGCALECRQCNQLQLYFHGTEAPIAILTDGNLYRFYSDLEAPNKMDSKPYMEFCLDDMDEALIPELRKLAKGKFDREACMVSANELKYNREFKQVMARQLENPDDDFARFFISQVFDGMKTQNVIDRFKPILVNALEQFINDRINNRLKNAMTQQRQEMAEEQPQPEDKPSANETESQGPRIVTTPEEKEAWYLIKSILMGMIDPERIKLQDWQNYCNIVLDNRFKILLRLYFDKQPWRIGFYDGDNKDEKIEIMKLDDILSFADRIRATAKKYDDAKKANTEE